MGKDRLKMLARKREATSVSNGTGANHVLVIETFRLEFVLKQITSGDVSKAVFSY